MNIDPNQTWPIENSITFSKTKEAHGVLSNMAGQAIGLKPLVVSGITCRTAEHLYQALRYPDFPITQQKILNEPSPLWAKKIARREDHLPQCRPDWDMVNLDIMRFSIRVKLAQNYDLFGQELLLSDTNNIVEIAPKRSSTGLFWGAEKHDLAFVGSNVMGQLLMELRQELQTKTMYEMLIVPNFNIPNLTLLGQTL